MSVVGIVKVWIETDCSCDDYQNLSDDCAGSPLKCMVKNLLLTGISYMFLSVCHWVVKKFKRTKSYRKRTFLFLHC